MSDNITTSEILNRAADLIEKRGWATGNCGMAVTGPTCLEGAIGAAIGAETEINFNRPWTSNDPAIGTEVYTYQAVEESTAYAAVNAYLKSETVYRPYDFNDEVGRTAAEVIEVLRATALIEAARESSTRIPSQREATQ